MKDLPLGVGWEASFSGSLQHRYQALDNRRDFTYKLNDEDFSLLARERLSLDVHRGHLFRAFVEVQDAHEFFRDRLPGTNPQENALDVYQAFVELGIRDDVCDKPSLVFRAGRQTLVYGHEHVFGDNDWLNLGTQNYDLLKAVWRPDGFQVDAFAGWPVTLDHRNPDTPASHVNLAGGNLKALGIPHGHNIEGLFLYKWNDKTDLPGERAGVRGPEHLFTFNALADGSFAGRWDYKLEATWQTGERGEDNILAWRSIAELGYTIPIPESWKTVRLSLNYSRTSGDKDPTDGISQTFDSLFARQFDYHGKLLVAGAKNLEDLNAGLRAKVWRGGTIEANYHLFRLLQDRDAFYQSNGRPLRRDRTGNAGKDAGQEFDVQVTHTFHENLTVTGGAFIFRPGDLFNKSGNRGHDPARSFFVMVRVGF